MSAFSELANVRLGDVERPKPLPNGHYLAQLTGPAKEHKAKSGNLGLRFPFRLVGPGEDVDQEELATLGGLPEKDYTIDFWMSPDARYRFTEFAASMGAGEDMNIVEAAEYLAGCGRPFLIEAKQEPSQDDPEKVYTRFDNPVAAE